MSRGLRQPIWPRFLPTATVVACAQLGPLGRMRLGPGTWGAAAGMVYQLLFFQQLGPIATVLLSLIPLYLAVALCGEAEFRLGQRDPGGVVLDEFVVMPLCFLGWPWLAEVVPVWAVMLAGFLLFRVFDIAKPLGIARLQDLPGGWGVVADDLAAALATCATLHGARLAWLQWGPGTGAAG